MLGEQYLTIKKTARILGVTPLTLRNWDKRGVLAAYRNPVNNYRLYRYADVADFLARIRQSGPRQPGVERLRVRLEDETVTNGSMETETAPPGGETPDAELGAETSAPYRDTGYADTGEQQVPENETQSNVGAV